MEIAPPKRIAPTPTNRARLPAYRALYRPRKMPDSNIIRKFNKASVEQRVADGYVNLNQMAKASGKRVDNWLQNRSTQELLEEFDRQQTKLPGIPGSLAGALVTIEGRGGGTWAHPDVAIQFAQWCSPGFALQVSRWVREWMVSGRSPLADIDRVGLRSTLKDDSRLRMTDQVKVHLQAIQIYDNRKHRGQYFARIHDAINIAITGETAKQMRERLSVLLNKKVKEGELIRDYFPSDKLSQFISLCEVSANLMIQEDMEPLAAVDRAARMVLYAGYTPTPINFVEHIKFVRQRLTTGQGELGLPEADEN